jgi:hypothetical protein
MPELSIIVWDETVPDLAAAARLFDMGGASDAKVREALGSGRLDRRLRGDRGAVLWTITDLKSVYRVAPPSCPAEAQADRIPHDAHSRHTGKAGRRGARHR